VLTSDILVGYVTGHHNHGVLSIRTLDWSAHNEPMFTSYVQAFRGLDEHIMIMRISITRRNYYYTLYVGDVRLFHKLQS